VRSSLFRRAFIASALVLGVGAPIVAIAAQPASAAGDQIAAAGSDTTQDVMDQILAGTGAVNVHVPKTNTAAGQTVAADTYCNSVTYNNGTAGTDGAGNAKITAPANSGEGRNALSGSQARTYPTAASGFAYTGIASTTGGCIDIARSSSKGGAGFENYAFGLDAVAQGTLSLSAPSTLTLAQVREIWNCQVNDWSQVGGAPGAIQRVLPKFGSGTRKYFINSVLGNTSETDSVPVSLNNSGTLHNDGVTPVTCPAVIGQSTGGVEENNGNEFTNPTNRLLAQQYVFPYSAGKWVQQATGAGNPSIDIRNGVRMIAIAGNQTVSGNYSPAYAVRWTGTAWRLNDGQVLTGATGQRSQAGVNAAAQFAPSLTGIAGTFSATDVGKQVQGTGINDGTTILSVAVDGSSATISPGAKAAIVNGTVSIGWAVVSEKNPVIAAQTNTEYPGVRFVYNILSTSGLPTSSYTAAQHLVGFDDTQAAGFVSDVCNGNDQGLIEDAGFLSLPALLPAVNTTPVSCRKL